MEKYRRARIITIIVLMIVMAGLTIGFAAFTSVLSISSSANVTPNDATFSVKFSNKKDSLDESAVVPTNASTGVEYENGKINNASSPTLTNLSAVFTSPGQSVTYTVYARNEGEYTAYLNNINYIGEKKCTPGTGTTASLVEAACNSIKMTVTVAGTEYTATTAISGHALAKKIGEEVKVKLSYDSNGALADGEFTVNFGDVTMVYSSIDDSTFVPPTTGDGGNGTTLTSIISKDAVSDSSVDFGSSTGLDVENNIAYIVNGTENDTNPIYYYRGNVTKNNVIFANFCWKIVRTTETGGTKLIYNGVPAADGSCNNTGMASNIKGDAFNIRSTSIDDVRYIYADGTDSTIKSNVDDWYEDNMTAYTSQLEDTVWCNDRSIYKDDDYGTYFGAYGRLNNSPYKPSLECGAEYQMTVASTDIDKHMNYPIALLTADEITLAGNGRKSYSTSSYLTSSNNSQHMWTLSPDYFDKEDNFSAVFVALDIMSSDNVLFPASIRPSISLAPNTEITGTGDGSVTTPYVVE